MAYWGCTIACKGRNFQNLEFSSGSNIQTSKYTPNTLKWSEPRNPTKKLIKTLPKFHRTRPQILKLLKPESSVYVRV